ncbi:hypothetical protein S83_056014 [Arachis hypogaea]
MPLDSPEEALVRYARCYIMYLLGGVLRPDKANNTVHVRYLPLLANYEAISTYSWGSAVLCWLYRGMCLATDYNVEGMSGCHTLLMSWIYFRLPFWALDVMSSYTFPLATTWAGKRGKNDYAEQRLQRHRLRLDNLKVDEFVWMPYRDARILSRVPADFLGAPHGDFYTAVVPLILFRWIEIVNIDRVMRQFGGKQGPPNPPLNIDTFHRQSARNDDEWWPIRLQTWFEVWANRRTVSYRLEIDRADTLHPSHDYYRWYCSRTKRFLSPPEAFHDPRGDDIPREAPAEYGRGPVVQLPAVPQDRRRHRSRRGRHQAVGADEMHVPDSPVPDPGQVNVWSQQEHRQVEVNFPGDVYCPQPFVAEDPFQSSTVHQYMPYNSTYEEGGSSQGGGTQDLIDHMDRVGWTNFSSLFDGLDQFIPSQASPRTPTDLGLALRPSDSGSHPPVGRRRSVSVGDTAGSQMHPFEPSLLDGRRLLYAGADDVGEEAQAGRPRRDTRAPSYGTGGRLGHAGHHH